MVGKSFGVIKITDKEGDEYDFSIPRRESKTGISHKDFAIIFDTDITPIEAAGRRDFTINAMAYDPISEELYDFFDGEEDLKNNILRATTDSFKEDPLRVLRGMQFCSRLSLNSDIDTLSMCSDLFEKVFEYDENIESYKTRTYIDEQGKEKPILATERIYEEWLKLINKGKDPRKGINFLFESDWIKAYPQINNLKDIQQDKKHHPEGDVLEHTIQSMENAYNMSKKENLNSEEHTVLVLSALCHDMGKPVTTEIKEDKITSYGHDESGVDISNDFLQNIGMPKNIIEKVLNLVKYHMIHITKYDKNSKKWNVYQIADMIYPSSIEQLCRLMKVDKSARESGQEDDDEKKEKRLEKIEELYEDAKEKEVLFKPIKSFFQNSGGKLLYLFPDTRNRKYISQVQKYIREKQKEGRIKTPNDALMYAENFAKRKTLLIDGLDIINTFNINPKEKGYIIPKIKDITWEAQLRLPLIYKEDAIDWMVKNINIEEIQNV